MLIDNKKNEQLMRIARVLLSLDEKKRSEILSLVPTTDRILLVEMLKTLKDDRPLLVE